MIIKWRIGNFKSIREPVELSLAPLTIFCGPNSSGKSAFIKSILMAAQSLSSSAWEEPLVLNGRFLSLGPLEEVLHHGYVDAPLELGFTLQLGAGEHISVSAQMIGEESKATKIAGRLNTRVTRSEIKSTSPSGEQRYMSLVRQPMRLEPNDLSQATPIVSTQLRRGLFDYKVVEPTYSELTADPMFANVLCASLHNFLPGRLLVRVQSEVRGAVFELRQLTTLIQNMAAGLWTRAEHGPIAWNSQLSEATKLAFDFVLRHLPPQQGPDPYRELLEDILASQRLTLGQCFDLISRAGGEGRLRGGLLADLARRLAGAQTELVKIAGKMRNREKIELEVETFPAQYAQVVGSVRELLGKRIHYLGPLRDDPRVIYAIPSFPDQRGVGLKGEYTAAMLETFGNQEDVDYPVPPDPAVQFSGHHEIRRGKLLEAVEIWLRRMGLAEGIDTVETAKVGYQLNLRDASLKRELDLTSVGVGVSQVLPTLVMAMLAPSKSVLIFEQPEVHLHPKVQSVLGDFFLGIVATGKQCLVETHSEHIINRIRRRIAESQGETILDQTRIYFVERRNAVSEYRSVESNEYGAILEWPQGFFDEVETEAGHILEAAVQKRQELRKQRPQEGQE